MTTPLWRPDVLGAQFHAIELPLGADPDGEPAEGPLVATLVRYRPERVPEPPEPCRGAVLYVHGFTDYFFQRHVAEFYARHGLTFYAVDLRKCGRSLRGGQTPHFVTDLAFYDEDLRAALNAVSADTDGAPVLLAGHSTGGLILPLWLDRVRRGMAPPPPSPVMGLVLNSPWFDLQGPSFLRGPGTLAIDALGRLAASAVLPVRASDVYGSALHESTGGDWSYDLDWKPLSGFPIRAGWLRAVRAGHAQLHRGLDVAVPSLILRSDRTVFTRRRTEPTHRSDTVLDVRQIARWSGCVGGQNTIVPIPGALHDVFLSAPPARGRAFDVLERWIRSGLRPSPAPGTAPHPTAPQSIPQHRTAPPSI